MNTEWIITDPDTNQRYRKILDDPMTLVFKEDRLDPITGEKEVYGSIMCLDDHTRDEILDACEAFSYEPSEVIKWLNSGENTELILECLFELES